MPSEKILLYTSKTLSNGDHPIVLRIIKNGKPRYLTIGRCKAELWDFKNNLPTKKHPNQEGLKTEITAKLSSARSLMFRLNDAKQEFTAKDVTTFVGEKKEEKTSSITVSKYFDNTVERLKGENKLGYAAIFKATKTRILLNLSDVNLKFSNIDEKFIRKVKKTHENDALMPNSIFVYLRTFKTLISYAKQEGIVAEEYNPFKNIDFKEYRRIRTKKRAISKEDIKKIIDYQVEEGSRLFHSRNYFLFSYYNRGINFVDIANLRWISINNGRLLYNRQKVNKDMDMEILQPAVDILDYYKRNYNSSNKDYVFPIINPEYLKPVSIRYRIKKVLKETNTDLNTIAKSVGIESNLTTYVARHSFATIMKKSGVPIPIISEMLAHGREKTTQIYLDDFGNDVLDAAAAGAII